MEPRTSEKPAEPSTDAESIRRVLNAVNQIVDTLAPLPQRERAQVLLSVIVRFDGVLSRNELHRLVEVAAGLHS